VKKDKDENGDDIEEEVFAEEDNRDDKDGNKEKVETGDAGTFIIYRYKDMYTYIYLYDMRIYIYVYIQKE
jgi:hypothetical protein